MASNLSADEMNAHVTYIEVAMNQACLDRKRIAELEAALKLSAERWQDVGEIIAEDGKYADFGFCKATARRCFNVLDGKEWGDPAGIFSATTNK